MSAHSRLRATAKRVLPPSAQDVVGGWYRGLSGPRRPLPFQRPPSDDEGAAAHAVLIAHATRKPADVAAARAGMGRVVIHQPRWVPVVPGTVPGVDESGPAVILLSGASAPHAGSAVDDHAIVLRLGGHPRTSREIGVLPNAAQTLALLGVDEQARVLAACALGRLPGTGIRSIAIDPEADEESADLLRAVAAALGGSGVPLAQDTPC